MSFYYFIIYTDFSVNKFLNKVNLQLSIQSVPVRRHEWMHVRVPALFFLRMIFAIFQLFFKLISFTNVRCYHSTVFWTTFTMFQLSFFLGMIFVTFQLPFKLVFYERSYERSSLLISLLLSSVDLFYPFCRHFKLVYLQRFSLSFYLSIEIVFIEQRPAVII